MAVLLVDELPDPAEAGALRRLLLGGGQHKASRADVLAGQSTKSLSPGTKSARLPDGAS
jgi:hypothetical protein